METKNILLYIILAAVVFLSIVGIINLLKPSPNLNNSKQTIDSVLKIVTESKEIITNQTKTIDRLQKMNADLYLKVLKADSINKVIKFTIDTKFSLTNKNIKDLKQELKNIQIPVIH